MSENLLAASTYERLGFEVAWTDEASAPGETTVWRRKRRQPDREATGDTDQITHTETVSLDEWRAAPLG